MDANIKEGLLVSSLVAATALVVGFKFCKSTIGTVQAIRAQAAAVAAAEAAAEAAPAVPAEPQQ